MAVTENMVYKIEIEDNSKEAYKNINEVTSSLKGLEKQTKDSNLNLRQINPILNNLDLKMFDGLRNQLINSNVLTKSLALTMKDVNVSQFDTAKYGAKRLGNELVTLNDTAMKSTEGLSKMDALLIQSNEALVNTSKSVAQLNKASSSITWIERIGIMNLGIEALINNINKIFFYLEKVTNPANLKRFAQIINYMAAYQLTRGRYSLASRLSDIANQIDIIVLKVPVLHALLKATQGDFEGLNQTLDTFISDRIKVFILQNTALAASLVGLFGYSKMLSKNFWSELNMINNAGIFNFVTSIDRYLLNINSLYYAVQDNYKRIILEKVMNIAMWKQRLSYLSITFERFIKDLVFKYVFYYVWMKAEIADFIKNISASFSNIKISNVFSNYLKSIVTNIQQIKIISSKTLSDITILFSKTMNQIKTIGTDFIKFWGTTISEGLKGSFKLFGLWSRSVLNAMSSLSNLISRRLSRAFSYIQDDLLTLKFSFIKSFQSIGIAAETLAKTFVGSFLISVKATKLIYDLLVDHIFLVFKKGVNQVSVGIMALLKSIIIPFSQLNIAIVNLLKGIFNLTEGFVALFLATFPGTIAMSLGVINIIKSYRLFGDVLFSLTKALVEFNKGIVYAGIVTTKFLYSLFFGVDKILYLSSGVNKTAQNSVGMFERVFIQFVSITNNGLKAVASFGAASSAMFQKSFSSLFSIIGTGLIAVIGRFRFAASSIDKELLYISENSFILVKSMFLNIYSFFNIFGASIVRSAMHTSTSAFISHTSSIWSIYSNFYKSISALTKLMGIQFKTEFSLIGILFANFYLGSLGSYKEIFKAFTISIISDLKTVYSVIPGLFSETGKYISNIVTLFRTDFVSALQEVTKFMSGFLKISASVAALLHPLSPMLVYVLDIVATILVSWRETANLLLEVTATLKLMGLYVGNLVTMMSKFTFSILTGKTAFRSLIPEIQNLFSYISNIKNVDLEPLIILFRNSFSSISSLIIQYMNESFIFMSNGFASLSTISKLHVDKMALNFKAFFADFATSTSLMAQALSRAFITTNQEVAVLIKNFSVASGIDIFKRMTLAKAFEFSEVFGSIGAAITFFTYQVNEFTDNTTVKFLSSVGLIMSILFGGFRIAFVMATNYIGDFFLNAGIGLAKFIDTWEKEFQKAEVTLASFQFTIRNFGIAYNENVVGTFEQWSLQVDKIARASVYGVDEIRTAIKMLVAEGQSFKFNMEDNVKLINRIVDVASITGNTLMDTTNAFVSGLAGNSQSLINYGINISGVGLAHSELAMEMKKPINEMNQHEILMLRLGEIYKQTSPLIGAAAVKIDTIYGSTEMLNKAFEKLQQTLGKQGAITKALIRMQTMLVNSFNYMPKIFITATSNVADFGSVLLIFMGVVLKFVTTVMTLTMAFKYMGLALVRFPAIAAGMTAAFAALGTQIGVATFTVTGLASVGANLVALMKGMFLYSLRMAVVWLGAFAKAVWLTTKAILSSPLFWKMAIIAGALMVFSEAAKQLGDELHYLKLIFIDAGFSVSLFSKEFEGLYKVASGVFNYLVKGAKFLLTSFLQILNVVGMLFNKIRKSWDMVWNDGLDAKAYDLEFTMLEERLYSVDEKMQSLAANFNIWNDQAMGAESVRVAAQKVAESLAVVKYRQEQLASASKSIDKVSIATSILGNEFEKAALQVKLANKELAKISKAFMEGEGSSKEKLDEYKRALTEVYQSESELSKLRKDTNKTLIEELTQLRVEGLKNSGKLVEASNLERSVKLKAFEERVQSYKQIFKLTKEEIKLIDDLRTAIQTSTTGLMSSVEQLNTMKEIRKETLDIEMEIASLAMGEIDKIKQQTNLKIIDLEKRKEELKLYPALQKELDKTISKTKELGRLNVFEEMAIQLGEVGEKTFNTLKKAFEDMKNLPEMKFDIGLGDLAREAGAEAGAQSLGQKMMLGFKRSWNASIKFLASPFQKSTEAMSKIALKISTAFSYAYTGFSALFSFISKIFDPEFIQGIADSLVNIMEKLPETLMAAYEALGSIIDKIIDKFPEMVSKLMDSLSEIIGKLAEKMPALINSLMDGLVKFLDKLPDITGKIFAALPKMLEAFLNKLPEVIVALFRAIPQIISQILEAIPRLIAVLMDKLPSIIETLIIALTDAIDKIAVSLIDFAIGGGVEKITMSITRAIPRIIVAIVVGSLKSLQNSWNTFWKGGASKDFQRSMAELPEKLEKGIKKLAATVAKESSQVFKVLDLEGEAKAVDRASKAKSVTDVVNTASDYLNKTAKSTYQKIIDGLTDVWRWVYDKTIEPLLTALRVVWLWIYEKVIQPLISGLKAIWLWIYEKVIQPLISGIKAVWSWIYNYTIKPMLDGITAVWRFVWDYILKPIFEGIKKDWNTFVENLKAAWNTIKELWDGMVGVLKGVWDGIELAWKSIIVMFSAAWDIIKTQIIEPLINGLTAVWDTIKTNVIDPLLSGLTAAWDAIDTNVIQPMKKIFDSFTSAFGDVVTKLSEGFTSGVKKITEVFDGIGEKIKKALNFADFDEFAKKLGDKIAGFFKGGISGMADGIANTFSEAFKKIGNLASNMFSFDMKGKGTVEKMLNIDVPFVNFAFGGPVGKMVNEISGTAKTAGDSLVNDVVPALLSPGEAVIPRSVMSIPGVPDLVDSLLSGNIDKVISEMWSLASEKLYGNLLSMFSDKNFSMAYGGIVGESSAQNMFAGKSSSFSSDRLSKTEIANYNITLSVNLEPTNTQLDSAYVRNKLIPTIKDELKKASLKGDFILADRGIRKV